jgi:hypothetical protein
MIKTKGCAKYFGLTLHLFRVLDSRCQHFGGPPWPPLGPPLHDQLAGWTLYLFATDDDETVLCVRALYKYTFLVDMQSAAMSQRHNPTIP